MFQILEWSPGAAAPQKLEPSCSVPPVCSWGCNWMPGPAFCSVISKGRFLLMQIMSLVLMALAVKNCILQGFSSSLTRSGRTLYLTLGVFFLILKLETFDQNICVKQLFVQNGTFHFQMLKYSFVTCSFMNLVRFVVVMIKKKCS